MPLTPADVHNVAFSKPPIGKRGYNEDEVDAFLDLVENELTRLFEENRSASADWRTRPRAHDIPRRWRCGPAYSGNPVVPAGAGARRGASAPRLRGCQRRTCNKGRAGAEPGAGHRRSPDRNRQAEADKLVADARANSEQMMAEARHTAETTVNRSTAAFRRHAQ